FHGDANVYVCACVRGVYDCEIGKEGKRSLEEASRLGGVDNNILLPSLEGTFEVMAK
ncbi:hypothetical protein BgiBS90_028361, partial [Biomphalaria glabrata]